MVSIAPAQRLSHLFLLHRMYYTPQKLFKLGWRQNNECPRCGAKGDFLHMVWRCPKLYSYWVEITERINRVFGSSLDPVALTCLLGCMEDNQVPPGNLEAILRCLFQARKIIAQKWQAHAPPSVENWVATINLTISSERAFSTRQGNLSLIHI